MSQVNPHWPSPETVFLGANKGDSRAPPPQVSAAICRGEGSQRGQTKYNRRKTEIEASPVGGSHITPGERLLFSGLRGPSTGPPDAPGPSQAGLGGRGRDPRGVSAWAARSGGRARGSRSRGGLGPFGESQALFSIVNKEREISSSADASADTPVLVGGGEGERKCHFFPRENTSEAFMSAAKGEFWGGAGEDATGVVGGGEGRFTVYSGSRGVI